MVNRIINRITRQIEIKAKKTKMNMTVNIKTKKMEEEVNNYEMPLL